MVAEHVRLLCTRWRVLDESEREIVTAVVVGAKAVLEAPEKDGTFVCGDHLRNHCVLARIGSDHGTAQVIGHDWARF